MNMIIKTRGDVIKLSGVLVENQWPAIKSTVTLLLDDHPQGVVIDASGLTEVSDTGARTFLDASTFIQTQNARVVVAGMPEEILSEIRNIPGLRSQLVVAATVEEARASLQSGGTAAIPESRTGHAVLVPLLGAWTRALQYAAVHAADKRSEIHLLYVLEIPRNLPMGLPVPEMEREAQHALDEAERMLRRSRVRVRKLTTRSREVVDGAVRFAAETNPDMVVVAFLKSQMASESQRHVVMNSFCREFPGDLAVFCVKD